MISHASRVMTRLLLTVWPTLLLLALLSLACAPPRRFAPAQPTVVAPSPIPLQFEFVTKWGSEGSGPGQFKQPSGIAVDSLGNVYVFDSGNYRVQKFSPGGEFLTQWGRMGTGDGQFGSIGQRSDMPHVGMAADREGNVYVSDNANYRVQKFTADGQFLAKWGEGGRRKGQFAASRYGSSGVVNYPVDRSVAVDNSGNVWVTDSANHRVQKFDRDGNFLAKWGVRGKSIAVDISRNIYVISYGGMDRLNVYGRIVRLNEDGQVVNILSVSVPFDMITLSFSFEYTRDMAVDALGNFYVLAHWGSYVPGVAVFDANGQLLALWGSEGRDDGQFDGPRAIVVDGAGNVYVADTNNNRIQKFRQAPTVGSQP